MGAIRRVSPGGSRLVRKSSVDPIGFLLRAPRSYPAAGTAPAVLDFRAGPVQTTSSFLSPPGAEPILWSPRGARRRCGSASARQVSLIVTAGPISEPASFPSHFPPAAPEEESISLHQDQRHGPPHNSSEQDRKEAVCRPRCERQIPRYPDLPAGAFGRSAAHEQGRARKKKIQKNKVNAAIQDDEAWDPPRTAPAVGSRFSGNSRNIGTAQDRFALRHRTRACIQPMARPRLTCSRRKECCLRA